LIAPLRNKAIQAKATGVFKDLLPEHTKLFRQNQRCVNAFVDYVFKDGAAILERPCALISSACYGLRMMSLTIFSAFFKASPNFVLGGK
jgi:hypothetical protein